jgi:hypothetical protein
VKAHPKVKSQEIYVTDPERFNENYFNTTTGNSTPLLPWLERLLISSKGFAYKSRQPIA